MKPVGPVDTNPWLGISAAEYEAHMGPDHADQLAPLSAIFAEVYGQVRPRSLALLGCATGNGLEHIDPAVTRGVVAVDINPDYLAVVEARHRSALAAALQIQCADVCSCLLSEGSFDLIHAALIFEHVAAPALTARLAAWLAPGGTCSVVLQIDGGGETVTPSPYRSVAALARDMRPMSSQTLADLLAPHGLEAHRRWVVPVTGGKQLAVALFGRRA